MAIITVHAAKTNLSKLIERAWVRAGREARAHRAASETSLRVAEGTVHGTRLLLRAASAQRVGRLGRTRRPGRVTRACGGLREHHHRAWLHRTAGDARMRP